ncbi:hypothetical protein J1N35_037415 [Gossypium stocksii]|uniref:Uncharacterized protein n=1 Tax=Gossypium stocksii TaxID=47602 RepID=A0A9D3UK50_9ROSI|nr:hypothetical protein J1N35_037415 [Gossypium stocksii]
MYIMNGGYTPIWSNWGVTQGIIKPPLVMVEAESFVEFGSRKDKFESSKLKEMSNGGGGHGEDVNGNCGNVKNGGNEKPHNGKWNS